ncbi:hypothetical protein [Cytobacillus praedii]|nr:hypothetical protein [Cytobacillus praedii]
METKYGIPHTVKVVGSMSYFFFINEEVNNYKTSKNIQSGIACKLLKIDG